MKTTRFTIFFVVVLTAIVVYSLEPNPHEFSEAECSTCHEDDSSGLELDINDRITLICNRCHSDLFDEGYMHPIDIRPQMVVIPNDMPLSSQGNITCNTCHYVHAPYTNPLGGRSYFLRRYETGKSFCDVCHENRRPLEGKHPNALGEAHFLSKYIATDPSQKIDPMSKNCISCHDGSYATSVTINAGIWAHSASSIEDMMGTHPIGVDYEMARVKFGRKTDLRPINKVDKRLVFFEGKIGCGTCHNPYTNERKYLNMEDRRSQLCYECHKMDGR